MIFIADNGSNIICRGYETFSAKIDPETIGELVRYIRENRLGYPVISSKTTVFVETEDPEFLDLMINGYHNHVRVMKDVLEADETIIKAAIFRRPNIRDIAQKVTEDWKDRLHVMAAGDPWLDFVDYQADKGYALKSIQKLLGIKEKRQWPLGIISMTWECWKAPARAMPWPMPGPRCARPRSIWPERIRRTAFSR